MWLYYWRANGINLMKTPRSSPCRHRWWLQHAYHGRVIASASPGTTAPSSTAQVTAITTQDIWKDHPGKGAGHHRRVRQENPNTRRLQRFFAGKWIDASLGNEEQDG
jgi:nitrate/nitrite transport system substrate-binding protein